MKIGIIGMGMVGEAVAFGLNRIGHEIYGYDINPSRSKCEYGEDGGLLDTQLLFICTPTLTTPVDGKCDMRSVWDSIDQLNECRYQGLVVIKSTVLPGTTNEVARHYPSLRVAFCPEFLRERARFHDFYENMEICIAGVFEDELLAPPVPRPWDVEQIREAHGPLPKHFVVMTPTEAELAKYFVNCFNAYRINFANAFFDVCKHLGADYNKIKDAVTHRADTRSSYLDSNEQFRAFGGACLPKDTQAFATFVASTGLFTSLFNSIVSENERVQKGHVTVDDYCGVTKERVA